MPRAEVKGILARPGEYKRKDGTVVRKTWEGLKSSFTRTPELILTLGHPLTPDGRPRFPEARDYLGRVVPVINNEAEVIEAVFKFHAEEWDKVPPHVQDKIIDDEPLEISLGYTSQTLESGERTMMLHNHVALLVGGESPICPLGECGINIRLESDTGDTIMTYEQATSTKEQEEAPEAEAQEDGPQEPPRTVTFTEEQFSQLLDTLRPREETDPEPSGDEPEEKARPEHEEEDSPAPSREPDLEPSRAFPIGGPSKKDGPAYLKEDGSVVVPHEHYLGSTKRKEQ